MSVSRLMKLDIRILSKSQLQFPSFKTNYSYPNHIKTTITKTPKEPSERLISIHHSSHSSFYRACSLPVHLINYVQAAQKGFIRGLHNCFMNPASGESDRVNNNQPKPTTRPFRNCCKITKAFLNNQHILFFFQPLQGRFCVDLLMR